MEFEFSGPMVEWRGPAPFHFVQIPAEVSADIKEAAKGLEYWGQVAVHARVNGHSFDTALFPREGGYLLPFKVAARRAAQVEEHDPDVRVELDLADRH